MKEQSAPKRPRHPQHDPTECQAVDTSPRWPCPDAPQTVREVAIGAYRFTVFLCQRHAEYLDHDPVQLEHNVKESKS